MGKGKGNGKGNEDENASRVRLEQIFKQHTRVDYLAGEVSKAEKKYDKKVGEARAEFRRIVESPDPGKSDARLQLLRQIQVQHQTIDEIVAERKTTLHDMRHDLKQAKARFDELCKNANQLNLPMGSNGDTAGDTAGDDDNVINLETGNKDEDTKAAAEDPGF